MCVRTLLLVLGAALELAGIALVAWDVFDARRVRERLSSPDKLVQVPPLVASARGIPPTVAGTGSPAVPPLDERVQKLEHEVETLSERIDKHRRESKQDHRDMLDTVSGWVGEARREVFELKQQLRPIIGRAAAGNIRRRGLGVVLFAIGLIMQTVANVAAP
jgi:hypothetical protein